MIINEEKMNGVDEIEKELNCIDEIKRKWWAIVKK